MALPRRNTELGNESLEKWKRVGSGGFGHVYKARHKDWGFNVAIKILSDGDRGCLLEEANLMELASCGSVLRLYGIYEGRRPPSPETQHGIVMEFMERGSVQSLIDLCGPPPYSLAFRLAHQVAVGMNFLHSRRLMHHDLKPSNVLLDDDLNAKIADFGLSRVSTSALSSNMETTTKNGGSYKYMPPEAFKIPYEPVRAFDIYSYGILLWSIVTGEEPYGKADYSLVALKIPEGQRPDYKVIDETKADGLKEMVDLMRKCWDGDPLKRPPFKECLKVTEEVFSKHKKGIRHTVNEVLTRLESLDSNPHSATSVESSLPPQTPEQAKPYDTVDRVRFTETQRSSVQESLDSNPHSATSVASSLPPQTPEQAKPYDTVDRVRFTETQRSSVQDSASVPTKRMTDEDKAKFVDANMAKLVQNVSEVMAIADALGGMVHRETYDRIAKTAPSQDQMRLLYRNTFPPGGVKVKAAFYDALKEHHAELVERLGG